MKRNTCLFFLLMMALIYSSCEKVIDLDLKDAEPRMVIEGIISNRTDTQGVKISMSALVGNRNVFPGVEGATVMVKDDLGTELPLRDRGNGIYSIRRMRGAPGRTYTLTVLYAGKEYKASSTMPQVVPMDSVGITTTTVFGQVRKSATLLYMDPAGLKNYYRFILTVNGQRSKNIFVGNDDFNDGKQVTRELVDFEVDLVAGDKVEIEMQSIDPVLYRYWVGLDENQNRGGASTTPANPVTNWSNGALGYFSAHTQQIEAVTVSGN